MADPFVFVPIADPMIGTVIGSFVITRLLGRGGMGAVYLAQHKAAAHIRCVFKTMLAHLSNNALMISRFNIETEAVGRLEHENIVELNDFGVLPNGQMYMQFEFIDGTPLDRFLAEWGGRLSLHRAIYLAFQVCDALDHAHAAGIVHRDLKPENLLVVVQDSKRVPRLVKIVDFGISKVARRGEVQTISGLVMGTPCFMSVEQYANAAEATAKSDVFSLSIILWLMITGELPWGHPDPTVLYHLQRTVVPTAPPEHVMPRAVANILLRCFSVDPDDRPTMAELAVNLATMVAATDDAPSGGAILMHIAPRFLTSSPGRSRTMPRAAVANAEGVAAQLWPPVKTGSPGSNGASRLPPLNVDARPAQPAPSEAELPLDRLASAPVAGVTAHASPHALAVLSVRPAEAAAPASDSYRQAAGEAGPVASPAVAVGVTAGRGLPSSVVAAFPTGLLSQKYAIPDPAVDALSSAPRVRSIVAAAEYELATGTPGPQPYAHSEMPAVIVSSTQLGGVTAGSSALAIAATPMPRAQHTALHAVAAGAQLPLEEPAIPDNQAHGVLLPPEPMRAALTTGLAAPRYAAQDLPVAPVDIVPAPPAVDPRLYSHTELPAVAVSTMQPSGITLQPTSAVPPAGYAEPPPFFVLPESAQPRSRRRLAAVGAALCVSVVAGVASFVLVGQPLHRVDEEAGSGRAQPGGALPNGFATRDDAPLSPSGRTANANQLDAGATVGSGSSVATDETSGVNVVSTNHPDGTASTAPRIDKSAGNAVPDSNRAAAPRLLGPKKTLQARQLEARTSGAQTGNLHLLATPWAVCWVDGEKIDQTPCMLDGLPVGRYRVRLENSRAHKDDTLTATVTAGQTTTIERTW
jgi:serine/threonine protein kinase